MAYKDWEHTDTFNRAFRDNRMSVRTFGSTFEQQLVKSVGLNTPLALETSEDKNRFFKDSNYTPVPQNEGAKAKGRFVREATEALRSFQPQGERAPSR
jgi:hypothetical protein